MENLQENVQQRLENLQLKKTNKKTTNSGFFYNIFTNIIIIEIKNKYVEK